MRATSDNNLRARPFGGVPAFKTILLSVALLAAFSSACATAAKRGEQAEAPAEVGLASIPPGFEGLNPTLWTQTSVEYRGLASQSYLLARVRLDGSRSRRCARTSRTFVQPLDGAGYTEDKEPR